MLDDLDSMLDEAIIAHEAKDFNSAAAKYTKILERDAHHADANHNFGLLTVELGLKDEALIFLQTAINTNPKVLQYWVTFIDTLTKVGRFDDARSVLEQANLFGYTEEVFDQLRHNLDLKQRLCEPIIKLGHANTTETVLDQVEQKLGILNGPIIERQKSQTDESGVLGELKLDQALKLAKKKIKDGEYEEAKAIYEDILKKFSKNKRALDGLKSLSDKPGTNRPTIQEPPIDQLQGLVKLYTQGQFKQAQIQASELLKQYPQSIILYNILGSANKSLGKLDDAIEAYKKALSIKPDYAEAYNNMGVTLQEQGKLKEAINAYKKAISIKPDYAEAYNNMGNAFKLQGKLDDAIEAYNRALSIKPDYADAYNNMGIALKEQGKPEESIEAYNRALFLEPAFSEAYYNMGNVLHEQGKLEEAIEAFNKALSVNPFNSPDYGRIDHIPRAQRKLLAEAHLNKGFALLNNGQLQPGLNEYEWRWEAKDFLFKRRDFRQPVWDGKVSLNGKTILVWGEQGPQDMIIWSTALEYLDNLAEHCILECPEKLVPLFARSLPNLTVKAENRAFDSDRQDFDYHIPMGSLFKCFYSEISKKKIYEPFLKTNPKRVEYWRSHLNSLGRGPFVGISWKSPLISPMRLPNYTEISEWSPILSLTDYTFINLQSTDFENDLLSVQDNFGVKVHNCDELDHYDNLDDVAALCHALDTCISVSTAVAAIAAGVGTSTKLLSWKQSPWNNLLLAPCGPFVDTYQRNSWETWDLSFNKLARDLKSSFPLNK